MDVDASSLQDVWLIKVPKYMAESWRSASANSTVGKLLVPKDNSGPVKFVTDSSLYSSKDNKDTQLPKEHSLKLTPLAHQKMVVLAQKKGGSPTPILVEGNVKFRGELRPKGDMSYMNLKSLSIKEAAKPNRVTQILDKALTSFKPRSATQLAHEADLRKKKDETKKLIREDKEIVQGRLFNAFEKQQYYNIKDLVRITNQSIPYLKEILKEICNYCPSGTHKNMWELKPEYRHYKSASGSSAK